MDERQKKFEDRQKKWDERQEKWDKAGLPKNTIASRPPTLFAIGFFSIIALVLFEVIQLLRFLLK